MHHAWNAKLNSILLYCLTLTNLGASNRGFGLCSIIRAYSQFHLRKDNTYWTKGERSYIKDNRDL